MIDVDFSVNIIKIVGKIAHAFNGIKLVVLDVKIRNVGIYIMDFVKCVDVLGFEMTLLDHMNMGMFLFVFIKLQNETTLVIVGDLERNFLIINIMCNCLINMSMLIFFYGYVLFFSWGSSQMILSLGMFCF